MPSAAETLQSELIRAMTPTQRLQTAQDIYDTAWQIKESGLRSQHPDWSSEQITAKTRRVFQTGYAGA